MYLPSNKLSKWRNANKPNRCPILEQATKDWVVDHDHKTGMVRGVISRVANSLVGKIENFLYSRCAKKKDDFPTILRNIADYLERKQTDVLHPVGLRQLANRFGSSLTAQEQYDTLRMMGASDEDVDTCSNLKSRKALFRKLTKEKYDV